MTEPGKSGLWRDLSTEAAEAIQKYLERIGIASIPQFFAVQVVILSNGDELPITAGPLRYVAEHARQDAAVVPGAAAVVFLNRGYDLSDPIGKASYELARAQAQAERERGWP